MRKIYSSLIFLILIFALSLPALAAEAEQGTDSPPSETGESCAHSFGPWSPAGDSHSRTCTLCGTTETATHALEEHIVTEAACTAAGSKTVSCAVCGYSQTVEIPPTGHSFSLQNVDGSNHKQVCSNCGLEESSAHQWSSKGWAVEPTCTSEGQEAFECSCGATKTEAVPKRDHVFSDWDGDEVTHTRTCAACGKVESGVHSWDSGTVILEPTCSAEGVRGYLCSGCDMVLLEAIPMKTTHTYDNDCDPDCNICGAVRDAGHQYLKVYSKNASGHWYTCRVCGEKVNFEKHIPGPAATEEKAQVCLKCGYVMTAKRGHVHDYQTEWTWDESGHWHACPGCEMQGDFEDHIYDNACDPDCNICGYRNANVHSFDGNWLADETGHWFLCSVCGEEGEHQEHIPGPEATETEPQLCTVCHFEIASVLEHVHEAGEAWQTDETDHWKVCECGEILEKSPHVWDDGKENEDSTVTYTCQECRLSKTEGEPRGETALPWWIVFLLGILVLIGAAAALIIILFPRKKYGKFKKR